MTAGDRAGKFLDEWRLRWKTNEEVKRYGYGTAVLEAALTNYIEAAIKEEREACAEVAEDIHEGMRFNHLESSLKGEIAAAIRARGASS